MGDPLMFKLVLAVLIFTLKSYYAKYFSSFLFSSARLTILILNQNSNDIMIHFIFIFSVSLYPAVLWCSILVWEVWSWPLPAASWILATELSLILVSFRLLSAKLFYNIVCPFSVIYYFCTLAAASLQYVRYLNSKV